MGDTQTIIGDYVSTSILKQPKRKLLTNEPLISSGLIDCSALLILPCSLKIRSAFTLMIRN